MRLPEFSAYRPAVLRRAWAAAAEQAWLLVEPPEGFLDAHSAPGQFCKMRVAEHEGIFAMYSSPTDREARFLVRVGNPDGGEAADALAALGDDTPVEMTLPAGDGFDLEVARGLDVRFVATGTGVAPVRAAIETVLAERDAYGELSLEYGLRTEAHLAIDDEIDRWRRLGLDVRLCYSRLDEDGVLIGATVQSSLRERAPDMRRACMVAVGQPAMLAELLSVMGELGGDAKRVLTNLPGLIGAP